MIRSSTKRLSVVVGLAGLTLCLVLLASAGSAAAPTESSVDPSALMCTDAPLILASLPETSEPACSRVAASSDDDDNDDQGHKKPKKFRGFCHCGCGFEPNCNTSADCG